MRERAHDQAFVVEDEVDLLFSRANPNPHRVGCPPRHVLSALAQRQRSMDDPGYVHLTRCSECFVAVRVHQQSAESRKRHGAPIDRWMMLAATIILTTGFGIWLAGRSGENRLEQQGASTSLTATSIVVDLRDRAIERGDPRTQDRLPVSLPRTRVALTIMLPFGAEPRDYELELVDTGGQVRASVTGFARAVDFITTIDVELDLTALAQGAYQFGMRARGEDWRFLSVNTY